VFVQKDAADRNVKSQRVALELQQLREGCHGGRFLGWQRAEGRGQRAHPRGLHEIEGMRLRAANQVGGLSILALHLRQGTSLNVLHVTMADS
jgi:hypothetical protein